MLIYNKNAICSNKNKFAIVKKKRGKGGGKRLKSQKAYKRNGKRKQRGYSCKLVRRRQSKKKKSAVKTKFLKRNTKFLEGLGLKVKKNQ